MTTITTGKTGTRTFQSTPSSRKVTICSSTLFDGMKISIHTFLTEGDLLQPVYLIPSKRFQSTPSSRKVTQYLCDYYEADVISIHTFLTEGDLLPFNQSLPDTLFQSTPSSRKVTQDTAENVLGYLFQSTPSSRKVTNGKLSSCHFWYISIHTFLTEGDGENQYRN